MSISYVYAITIDGTPRYIGKGTGRRALLHIDRGRSLARGAPFMQRWRKHHLYAALAKAISADVPVGHLILADGLTEDEAFALEAEIIATTSGLLNKAAGGRGGNEASTAASWKDPAVREARIAGMRRANADIWKGREDLTAERAQKGWADNPDRRQGQGAVMRKMWRDPGYRDRAIAGMLKRPKRDMPWLSTDEARARNKAAVKSSWDRMTPEERDARRAAMREGRRKAREARQERSMAIERDAPLVGSNSISGASPERG